MNHSIRFLIFDLDGTLVDSHKDIATSANWALSQMDLPTKTTEEVLGAIGYGIHNLVKLCLPPEQREDSGTREKALALFKEHYSTHLTDHSVLYPGVREFFQSPTWKHLKKVVLTNKVEAYGRDILQEFKLLSCFSAVIGGDTLPTRKPHPEGILTLLKNHGYTPEETLMIGDSVPDVEAARNAGVRSVGIVAGMGNTTELKNAAPDFLIHSFEELHPLLESLD
jgi:phosphoglycolate phosphatase